MKSLYESILGKTGTGIKVRIDEWCQEHNVYDGHYIINNDNTISPVGGQITLILYYDTYSKLPPYIKFKGDEFIDLKIGVNKKGATVSNPPRIDSFVGLPGRVRSCVLMCKNKTLDNFKIICDKIFRIAAGDLERCFKVDITAETIQFSDDNLKDFTGFKTHGVKNVIMVNDFNLGDKFSSLMNRKAEQNKYKNKFEIPVKPEALEVIKNFFEPWFDTETLESIEYTQNSKLTKHAGKWYRMKNWI